jgi:hypothetical protein
MGLIHDIPTCAELLAGIERQSTEILSSLGKSVAEVKLPDQIVIGGNLPVLQCRLSKTILHQVMRVVERSYEDDNCYRESDRVIELVKYTPSRTR